MLDLKMPEKCDFNNEFFKACKFGAVNKGK